MNKDLAATFEKLVEDDGFRDSVIADPDAALKGLDLDDEAREALVADADALSGDVTGHGMKGMPMANLGGLRVPKLLAPISRGLTSPLTAT